MFIGHHYLRFKTPEDKAVFEELLKKGVSLDAAMQQLNLMDLGAELVTIENMTDLEVIQTPSHEFPKVNFRGDNNERLR